MQRGGLWVGEEARAMTGQAQGSTEQQGTGHVRRAAARLRVAEIHNLIEQLVHCGEEGHDRGRRISRQGGQQVNDTWNKLATETKVEQGRCLLWLLRVAGDATYVDALICSNGCRVARKARDPRADYEVVPERLLLKLLRYSGYVRSIHA